MTNKVKICGTVTPSCMHERSMKVEEVSACREARMISMAAFQLHRIHSAHIYSQCFVCHFNLSLLKHTAKKAVKKRWDHDDGSLLQRSDPPTNMIVSSHLAACSPTTERINTGGKRQQ